MRVNDKQITSFLIGNVESYALPDGTETTDAGRAAEQWAAAFYMAKDVIEEIRPICEALLKRKPVRNLDEVLLACDGILRIGEK